MLDSSLLMCVLLFSALPSAGHMLEADAVDECRAVSDLATERGMPLAVVVSLAYHESKFDPDAKSKQGALGPLQALPRFYCPQYKHCKAKGRQGCYRLVSRCDLRSAGLDALSAFLSPRLRWADAKGTESVWRAPLWAGDFPRRVLEASLCKFVGCSVERKGRRSKHKRAFVRQILLHASWLQRSFVCRCSQVWR